MFGVNEYEFLLSVCGNANYIEFQVRVKDYLLRWICLVDSQFCVPTTLTCVSRMPKVDNFSFIPKMANI